jgi:peptidoglycan/LPS O-acetylase OafA/YrhL
VPVVLRTLGAASYSIYLFQFIIIGIAWQLWLASRLGKTVPATIGIILFSVATILAGVAISRLVEYPLLALFRSVGGNFSAAKSR